MSLLSQKPPYSLVQVPLFDARSGVVRCTNKGTGASIDGYASPSADFWRVADGTVLMRVSLRSTRHAFEARLISGEPISDGAMSDFALYVSEQLLRWTTDLDDVPFEEVAFPSYIAPTQNIYWLARLLLIWMDYDYENRFPEIVLELIPELSNRNDVQAAADEDDYGFRYSLLFDAIHNLRNAPEHVVGSPNGKSKKNELTKRIERLTELEVQLALFSLSAPSRPKVQEVADQLDKNLLWENDPFVLPKDANRWRSANNYRVSLFPSLGTLEYDKKYPNATALDKRVNAVLANLKSAKAV